MIIQHGVRCNRCRDRIFSNSRHDFVSCKCGASYVDGGFEYLRVGYTDTVGLPQEITRTLKKYPPYHYRSPRR